MSRRAFPGLPAASFSFGEAAVLASPIVHLHAFARLATAVAFLVISASGQTTLPASYSITTVAGTSFAGDGGKAVEAPLASVEGIAVDSAGNIYLADAEDHRVRKINPSGIITTVAGTGAFGIKGDGGPANLAQLNRPYGLAVDSSGVLYIADLANQRIRKVASDGTLITVAGGGTVKPPGEGGEALGARFQAPRNLAIDPAGNIFVSDFGDHRVYRITPSGGIAIVAGTGVAGFTESGDALSVNLNSPAGLALDKQGALYIADAGNNAVRKLLNGKITTLLGGSEKSVPLDVPTGLAFDSDGNLYIADSGRVYRRSVSGQIASLATGAARDVAADKPGNVYYSRGGYVYRTASGGGVPVVVAGNGSFGVIRENVDAGLAYLQGPVAVTFDDMGTLFIAEQLGKRVRQVSTAGMITTYAGGGVSALGDGGQAAVARLYDPVALAFDPLRGLCIADANGSRIRLVDFGGVIRTLAGDGEYGFAGENVAASTSRFNKPAGVAFDRSGNLYVSDTANNRIRKITPDGTVTTLAGSGIRGYYGDGGDARQAQLAGPLGLTVDSQGNVYFADTANNAIRKITRTGVITTVAGSGAKGFSGDNGSAILASFNGPSAVAVDSLGALYIADRFNNRIRRVSPEGVVVTIAGDGLAGLAGDGGPALSARLNGPAGVTVDSRGNVFVADTDNNRIRRLAPSNDIPVVPQGPQADVILMNGASYRSGPVAPGAIVSVFGSGIGPSVPSAGKLNAAGKLDASLLDFQVRFDGQPAPLFYVSADQINLAVPYKVAGQSESVVEVYQGSTLRLRTKVAVAAAAPGVFTSQSGVGQAIAVNEDGALNSASNPAARGSIMVLYVTGEGQTAPGGVDGLPASGAKLPQPVQDVQVTVGTSKAEVLWAGSAPGFVGLMQVNVRLPGIFTPPGVRTLTVTVGGQASQPGVTIAVQ